MVDAQEVIQALQLEVLVAPEGATLNIETPDINRPGIQLTGFWDYFAYERPQILGRVEMTYLKSLDPDAREERLTYLLSYNLPCIIICRGLDCPGELLRLASERKIPLFRSQLHTNKVVIDLINFLSNHLAPHITLHGGLVDVYGVGILITGESGVGKSEAALELVKRGHRLVADDVVDIRRVSDNRLIGESPEMVRHFMEIRGIGIIDIAIMFGIGAVIRSKSIDMVVHLEHWREDKEYERFGIDEEYTSILDVNVPKLLLPIRPGRNIAVVLEVAARNLRLKQGGYNAARELGKRFDERMRRSAEAENNEHEGH